MKKLEKAAALFLAAALMLTGCSQGGGAASSAVSGPGSSAEGKVDPEAKYAEPVTVSVAYATNAATTAKEMDGYTYEDNPWTRLLLEKYNIKIKILWEAVDANDQYKTKLDLAIASNALPDIIRTSNYSQFISLTEGDKVADLTNDYESYLSDKCKAYATQDGGKAKSYGIIDDKMFGVCASDITQSYIGARLIWVREDWMKQLNLQAPTTIEDVVEISKKFADAGKGRYALPLFKKVVGDNMCDIVGMANAFGAYPRMWKEDQSGNAVYGSVQPEMKQVLQTYADLYKGGYIDPAFASLDGTKVAEQLTSDKIGVIIGACWLPTWPLNSNFELNGTNWLCYPVLPSKNTTGDLKVQADPLKGSMLCVKKGYEHPEALFKILNTVTEKLDDPNEQTKYHSYQKEDGTTVNVFGMNPLGFYFSDMMTNFNTYKNCKAALETNDESKLVSAHDKLQYPKLKAYKEDIEAGRKPKTEDWTMAELFYGPNSAYARLNGYIDSNNYVVDLLPGYQTPEMVRQWGNLTMLEDQYFVEIISGTKDVDSGFQEFVDAWNAGGGETITKEVNDWYKSSKQ